MAKLIHSPPKYHPSEWHASNRLNYSTAEEERAAAERLRAECERLRKETDATTRRTQQNIDHKFSQRIRDIDFWKQELEQKLAENAEETEFLLQRKEQLEKALAETQFPLEVAQSCLSFREKRLSIDLVHDEVEIQLLKEVEVIQGVQALLQQTLDHTVEQIRLLRSCKYRLEKDLTDKLGALNIDSTCATLSDKSPEIGYSEGAVKVQTNSVTPDQWASFSDENILKTEQECNTSATLRGVIDGVLDQTKQDTERQRATVNLAFEQRIQETAEAKQSLEEHLEKILQEIEAMEENIAKLKEVVEAKEGPMKLAHTRLQLRAKRPNNELVRDPVQYGLVDEVRQISESAEQLQVRLADSESVLKGLIRNQLTLEEDIAVKTNSLHVDRDQCMVLRSQIEASASPSS